MDTIIWQKIKVDWQLLKEKCRLQAIENNNKENWIQINYKVKDLDLVVDKLTKHTRKAKLTSPTQGPFEIIRVYNNGNVQIKRGNYNEDISIQCLKPYHPKAIK